MRDPYQVLHEKQMQLLKLRKETAALRLVVSLIEDSSPVTIEGTTEEGSMLQVPSLRFQGN